jgi:hypothetical protein
MPLLAHEKFKLGHYQKGVVGQFGLYTTLSS